MESSEGNAAVVLTLRETQIITFVKERKSNGEIARIFSISERTVRFHLHNAFKKLGVENRVHAVSRAIQLGLTWEKSHDAADQES